MEDETDLLLQKIVRQKFKGVPDRTFNSIPLQKWIEMLSFDDQMDVSSQWSIQMEKNGLEQTDVSIISDIHKSVPVDVWAVMLKDSKNSVLRALCRTDAFFRANCFSIVKKIGMYRHGEEFFKKMLNKDRYKIYPVEFLIAYEMDKLVYDMQRRKHSDLLCQFFLKNYKKKLEIELHLGKSYKDLYARNAETIEYITVHGIYREYSSDPPSKDGFLDIKKTPHVDEYMNLLVGHQFDLWKVNANEEFETLSEEDGTPFIYKSVRPRTDVDHMTKCISCNIDSALFTCGNRCVEAPVYCSKECAKVDWDKGHGDRCK